MPSSLATLLLIVCVLLTHATSTALPEKQKQHGTQIVLKQPNLQLTSRKSRSRTPIPIIIESHKPPNNAVIFLHGFGQQARENVAVVKSLQRLGLKRTIFILPQAPSKFFPLFNATFTSWFDPKFVNGSVVEAASEKQVARAARNVKRLAQEQGPLLGIPQGRIAVVGYSQGGSLGITVVLRHRVSAVVAWSSFLVLRDSYPAALNNASVDSRLLMVHGSNDSLVPVAVATKSRDLIRDLGRKVKYVEFEGVGHELKEVRRRVYKVTVRFLTRSFTRKAEI